ncbi:MAG: lytic murein transglycosylase B [Gammaproteobacteria bacterium]|nr:lytic murein transglycosylase B [Gammaproteobacteria bacterium]
MDATAQPVPAGSAAPAATPDYRSHPRAAKLAELLRADFGFTEADLESVRAALADAIKNPKLIEAEQQAKERTLTWDAYRVLHLHDRNYASGLRFLDEQKAWLAKAEGEYGVPPAVVGAILGVETKFGSFTGQHRVLDSLATQGFDHPTRGDFFLRELAEFFALCREENFDPRAIKGSYAGAMGAAQFMPSNYRRLAVDFDGDGHRDLWQPADAIGSIANYLVNYRRDATWRRGEPLALPARLDAPADAAVPRNAKAVTHLAGDFLRAGIRPETALPPETPVGLIELSLTGGQEFWLGLPNFYGVMSYNPRVFYAMAVTQLAQALQQNWVAVP